MDRQALRGARQLQKFLVIYWSLAIEESRRSTRKSQNCVQRVIEFAIFMLGAHALQCWG